MTLLAMSKCVLCRRLVWIGVICVVVLLTAVGYALAQSAHPDSDGALIEKLRSGGYNLYVRHAATDWSQSDKINKHGDWVSCDPRQVRQLAHKGREDARELGAIFRSVGIRLGRVFASPYCRTMETARLISQQDAEPTTDMMNLRSAEFVGGREAVVARARRRLSKQPEEGLNNLFVAHGNLGRAATGQSLAEGEVLIVAPRGNSEFEIEGTLTLADLRQGQDRDGEPP